jgi:tRNA nucleotidyltransferase (CCA-adding enzyme)
MASFRLVSAERVRDELFKLLQAKDPARGIELMRETGLLAEVLPELLEGVGCAQDRDHRLDVYAHAVETLRQAPEALELRLAALLHDVGKPRARRPKPGAPGEFVFDGHERLGADLAETIAARLRLSNQQRATLRSLVLHHRFTYEPSWSDGAVRRFVRRVGRELVEPLLLLREADVAARGCGQPRELETGELRARLAVAAPPGVALTTRELAIDGKGVMRALALPPGRRVGQLLEALLEIVLDRPEVNTPAGLEALLPSVLREVEGPGAPAVTPPGSKGS